MLQNHVYDYSIVTLKFYFIVKLEGFLHDTVLSFDFRYITLAES